MIDYLLKLESSSHNYCAKFGLNWFSGSREGNFFVSVFLPFHLNLILKISRGPSFEQPRITFTSEYVVASSVEIGPAPVTWF